MGAAYAQIISYADLSDDSTDGQYICHNVVSSSACTAPATRYFSPQFLDEWFGTSGTSRLTPEWVTARGEAERRSIEVIDAQDKPAIQRVAHLSDIHLDPRYLIGAEAACTNGQCCRADSWNSTTAPSGPPASAFTTDGNVELSLQPQNISQPAVYWGAYKCDSPWGLVANTLSSVKEVITSDTTAYRKRAMGDRSALAKRAMSNKLAFSLFTGDMVTHESGAAWHLTRSLVWYVQQAIFDSFARWLGPGPVYSAIGNHDSVPSDFASPNSLLDGRGKQFSWDWNNVARLFRTEGWITDPKKLKEVKTHYAGYSVKHSDDLRIITLNTDMWYKGNYFNFINTSNPDSSNMLRFLTDELVKAEAANEKVWIIGHVLTGWSGTNGLKDPTNLFYQIVERFSPYTIRGIFFGHTHEDQFSVMYAKNGTTRATVDALNVAYMGPSITPGTNVNPSFRIYDVDPLTWQVLDYHQYYTQAADFLTLPHSGHGPVWSLLYSARATFGNFSASVAAGSYTAPVQLNEDNLWPQDVPLNGSYWAAVTDEMSARPELVTLHTRLSGRNSPRSPTCTEAACIAAKICYMRSGSSPLGQECPQGFDSVQSGTYH
ncbi:hypothetical protein K437DRAFT_67526 [Tilletiaria anomala UBC 951]|uniref:Calcineurin-like phosphoesterase domain-containing protein n=1 Tax=Tilletiaria anomala (strain ATCC 24038 / CBS 436.72 / UBC 951) TaxID=1037660 RepID=A0A066V380_TILAU|nr:uncharacterized protein K437DRAFT_67526 [Tilletiaria anomala UBC 951]KDN35861.1 hypothetical protein K437DRAFT_67526 [Tilletiaria anomala UBC 951]